MNCTRDDSDPGPDDEDERTFLLEAQHLELEEALQREEEVTVRRESMSPRLHTAARRSATSAST